MTGCGRVGQNRLLDPVFRTLRKNMNRLRFRFDPKRAKNRTEPDLQTLAAKTVFRLPSRDALRRIASNSSMSVRYSVGVTGIEAEWLGRTAGENGWREQLGSQWGLGEERKLKISTNM